MQTTKEIIMELFDKAIEATAELEQLNNSYYDWREVAEIERAIQHYRTQVERVLDGKEVEPYVNLHEWAMAIGKNTSASLDMNSDYIYFYDMKHEPKMRIAGYVYEKEGTYRRVGFLYGSYADGYDIATDTDDLPDWAFNSIKAMFKVSNHTYTVHRDTDDVKHTFIVKEK